jgi:uncharacterized protein (DUF736 family)
LQFATETSRIKDSAPDYRICLGGSDVGAAWKETARESGRVYWSVKLDDRSGPSPRRSMPA